MSQSVNRQPSSGLDARVEAFLERHRDTWQDLNVPDVDGRTLHDLIVKHRYTRALEIGTSTGHSGVWIAWALSKTGGRLTTLESDAGRRETALEHFREAGVAEYIDPRLGDAHVVVPTLDGPFDFVFSDADKEWYANYLQAVWPKVTAGGCFAAHNVSMGQPGMAEFLAALEQVRDAQTTIDTSSEAGLSLSFKR